jgi:hypothetical protein
MAQLILSLGISDWAMLVWILQLFPLIWGHCTHAPIDEWHSQEGSLGGKRVGMGW